jgi:hypothetical protein
MLFIIILPIIITLLMVYAKPKAKQSTNCFKISDRVFMTPNGIVDFDESPKLTSAQEFHNRMVDFEIEESKRLDDHDKKQDQLKIEAWEKFLSENPDYPFKSCPGLRMTTRPKKFYMKYVP